MISNLNIYVNSYIKKLLIGPEGFNSKYSFKYTIETVADFAKELTAALEGAFDRFGEEKTDPSVMSLSFANVDVDSDETLCAILDLIASHNLTLSESILVEGILCF